MFGRRLHRCHGYGCSQGARPAALASHLRAAQPAPSDGLTAASAIWPAGRPCSAGLPSAPTAFATGTGLFVLETTMRSLLIVTLLVFAAVGWLAFESLAP
jgi:hypothetical protein